MRKGQRVRLRTQAALNHSSAPDPFETSKSPYGKVIRPSPLPSPPPPPPPPQDTDPAMKVKITRWNTVATWRWDIPEDDVCGICQVHFDGTCPTCKYPGDDCSLLSGKCGHNFHMHCILEWIKQDAAKGQCPMCRQKFEWTDQTNETAET
ncbi:Anaphase-promoting complex subunit 11 [Colletotrichum tanaceti]|uniref:Anaphase-promoting complex subunit 11 n=1 Tax=Colletotrichum tanaceti TaxID=1306861 RepID=A0A4U6XUQ1_9PEZI|nr:Anaphase-promoting complex subunit 11 [Colletotrichum tanaceti]TKW59763.1 Anaphase-promoting complex subunit 11 [Colletotrichum tanaceti]